ncbi:hypothetical protein SAY86_023510 [Trapa natans]|uniref:SPARK domain-containing protein n=1 Tax=Trapa natans TaxID=22666 RepID=A0AAN7MAV0_TRANT|nr:hypothetical protein SAY86_023510 [Trapa natans]
MLRSTCTLSVSLTTLLFLLYILHHHSALAGLLAEPASGDQPYVVPAFPTDTDSQICKLDLSAELFGGVSEACGRNLDRGRCCPVLAAWLFAAHARTALQLPAPAPAPSPSSSSSTPDDGDVGNDMPMMPNDSQKCVDSLQSALVSKNVRLPQPNASCDAILCFCGIRLHQISSLSCPAAFNVSSGLHNATPTAAVKNLEKNCRNSSYAGCTKCLGALQKVKGGYGKNGTGDWENGDRARKMFNQDCQLMGLTWLLARNKTAYIPTVSAVLRAMMYSAHPPHRSTCSPDQENMPLAVDSLQLGGAQLRSRPPISFLLVLLLVLLFPMVYH